MAQLVKTVNGLAIASVKTAAGLAIASAKTILGLDNTAGGGSFVAGDFGTVEAWYRAEDQSGSPLATIIDHSANGYDLTQGTGAQQPTLVTNAHGSFSAIRFDGVNDTATRVMSGNCGTILAVIGRITQSSANALCGGDGRRMITFHPDAATIYGGDPSEFFGASTPTRVNGTTTYTFPASPAFAVVTQTGTPVTLGTFGLGASGINDPFNGDLLEVVLYSNTLDATNLVNAAAACVSKYSL